MIASSKLKNKIGDSRIKLQNILFIAMRIGVTLSDDSNEHTTRHDSIDNDHTIQHTSHDDNHTRRQDSTDNNQHHRQCSNTTTLSQPPLQQHGAKRRPKKQVKFINTTSGVCSCHNCEHDCHDNEQQHDCGSSILGAMPGANCNCSSQMSFDHHSSNSIAGRIRGLSAATVPASSYVSPPRVWESEGEEAREVMSLREGSPPAKLLCSETTGGKCVSRGLSTDARASPERMVPCPSTCTCHRRLIVNVGGTGGIHSGVVVV